MTTEADVLDLLNSPNADDRKRGVVLAADLAEMRELEKQEMELRRVRHVAANETEEMRQQDARLEAVVSRALAPTVELLEDIRDALQARPRGSR